MITKKIKVKKLGDDLVIKLPKEFIEMFALKENDTLTLVYNENEISIKINYKEEDL